MTIERRALRFQRKLLSCSASLNSVRWEMAPPLQGYSPAMATRKIDAAVGAVGSDQPRLVRFRPADVLDPALLTGVGELRRDGDLWRIAFGSATFALPDSKGIRQLAELLAHPGREFDAVDLASLVSGPAAAEGDAGSRARVNVTRTIHDAVRKISRHSSAFGLYLRATIRTGERCSYVPDPARGK